MAFSHSPLPTPHSPPTQAIKNQSGLLYTWFPLLAVNKTHWTDTAKIVHDDVLVEQASCLFWGMHRAYPTILSLLERCLFVNLLLQ
ncbi:hypothetical protein A2T98_10115 [Nodularia spumigena CENA596]|uniref:Uncharacterized protein n=1 Tax=Nodularia spumigena CENA596 TaxID=1819295 RepID=A0A166JNG3_NODSP|nr:hypothetical protein A2T98_10115 [Nodularia spumigena CENA596]